MLGPKEVYKPWAVGHKHAVSGAKNQARIPVLGTYRASSNRSIDCLCKVTIVSLVQSYLILVKMPSDNILGANSVHLKNCSDTRTGTPTLPQLAWNVKMIRNGQECAGNSRSEWRESPDFYLQLQSWLYHHQSVQFKYHHTNLMWVVKVFSVLHCTLWCVGVLGHVKEIFVGAFKYTGGKQ